MLKTLIRIGINTAIGVALIYFWLKLVNIQEILDVLESFNPWALVPALILVIFSSVFRALRFKLLLSKVIKVPALKIINLTFLSQLLSFTIPIRLGEVAKGVYLSTHYDLHFGRAVVWVFVDRFLDFWAVLSLSLLLLAVIPTNLPQGLTNSLLVGVVISFILVIAAVLKPVLFKRLAQFISHFLVIKVLKEKFLSLSYFVIDCFSLLNGSISRNLGIVALTVLGIFFEGLSWYVILMVFLPDVPLFKVWLGSMLNSLTFIIPAAPGYVGSAEAAGLAVFSYGLGLDKTFVSAATIIIHAISLVFILTSGIIGLYLLKFNLALVWQKLKQNSKN